MQTKTIYKPGFPAGVMPYLQEYTYCNGELELTCFIDYDRPDPSVGYAGSACLCHAYHAGVDISDYLSADVIDMIEGAACWYFSGR